MFWANAEAVKNTNIVLATKIVLVFIIALAV